MRVIIRDGAYHDLDRIHNWIAKDRPRVADSVIDRVLESIARLGDLPFIGHKGRTPETYEWVVRGLPYIIVYMVDSDHNEVQVTAVFHGAQDR